jgi:hypothetical protein
VRAYVPQEATNFVVLHHVPNGVGHGDKEHCRRSKEHAFHGDFVAKGRCALEPLGEKGHIWASITNKGRTNEDTVLFKPKVNN